MTPIRFVFDLFEFAKHFLGHCKFLLYVCKNIFLPAPLFLFTIIHNHHIKQQSIVCLSNMAA